MKIRNNRCHRRVDRLMKSQGIRFHRRVNRKDESLGCLARRPALLRWVTGKAVKTSLPVAVLVMKCPVEGFQEMAKVRPRQKVPTGVTVSRRRRRYLLRRSGMRRNRTSSKICFVNCRRNGEDRKHSCCRPTKCVGSETRRKKSVRTPQRHRVRCLHLPRHRRDPPQTKGQCRTNMSWKKRSGKENDWEVKPSIRNQRIPPKNPLLRNQLEERNRRTSPR